MIKHTLNTFYEAEITAKTNAKKQGRILDGGGGFSGWPEYIPLLKSLLDFFEFFRMLMGEIGNS